jgi:hypothetical protein
LRYPVPAGLVAGFMGATPVTAQFLALPDERKQALIAHVVEQLASYVDDTGLAVPVENHFLTASKRLDVRLESPPQRSSIMLCVAR